MDTGDANTLVARLRAGDEAAFAALVDRYGPSMLRLAEQHVSSRAVAEEVVQESWLGFLEGLARFEGRSSIATYLFRIVANRAKTRGVREGRTRPFSAFGSDEGGPTVDPERFLPADDRQAGHWASPVRPWGRSPEEIVVVESVVARIRAAIEQLPPGQRAVITLRDIEGLASDEVCDVLDLTDGNQRVLLHRARAAVRRVIEEELG